MTTPPETLRAAADLLTRAASLATDHPDLWQRVAADSHLLDLARVILSGSLLAEHPTAPAVRPQDRPDGADETPGAPGALRGAQMDAQGRDAPTLHALVSNAITRAINEAGEWVRLSTREAAAQAVLAVTQPELTRLGSGDGLRDRITRALRDAWFDDQSAAAALDAALTEVQPELDRLRDELQKATALAATWEQRHGDLRDEHRRQARAWDRGMERAKERAAQAEAALAVVRHELTRSENARDHLRHRADQAEARLAQAVRDLPERDLHDAIRRLAREDPAWLRDTIRRARFNAGSNTPAILGTPEEDHL